MDNRNIDNVGPNGDTVAGATGGAGGAVAGAALGSLAGPIGTIIGGLAGAVGGWWAGKSVADSPAFNDEDDSFYQNHHQSRYSSLGTADQSTGSRPSYNDVRPAYQLGHLAGLNPDYRDRSFDDVEPHLSSAYGSSGQNNWNDVRSYAQDAWSRGRTVGSERFGGSGMGGSGMSGSMSGGVGSGGLADVGGSGGSMSGGSMSGGSMSGGSGSSAGSMSGGSTGGSGMTGGSTGAGSMGGSGMGSSTGGTGSSLGDYGRDLRTGASNLGDRVADAVDDLKDRVDGNPASRPGRDETDRPSR